MKTTNTTNTATNTTKLIKEGKTMKKTNNMKLRIIASTLAALSIMSTMAVTTSAINVTDTETPIAGTYGEHAKSDFNHDIQVINPEFAVLDNAEVNAMLSELSYNAETEEESSKAEDVMKAIANSLIDTGIDMLGDAFPGGKLLSGALKAILGEATKGEDPLDALAEQEQKHFEELKERINDINDNITKYTNKLTMEIEVNSNKVTLGGLFNTLSSNLRDLSDKIDSIVGCNEYTPEQKRVLLAELNIGGKNNEKDVVAEVRQAADAISKTLGGNGGVLGVNLYNTLIGLCKGDAMFQGQAQDAAADTAKVLTEQFMYANTLLLQCQSAGTNLNFTDKEIEALGSDPSILEAYKSCIRPHIVRFQQTKFKDTLSRLQNGLDSFKDFLDNRARGNRLINQGKSKDEMILDLDGTRVTGANSGALNKIFNNYYFNKSEMASFIDYIKSSSGGKKSIANFLREHEQTIPSECYTPNGQHMDHRYIIVDPELKETKTEVSFEWYSDFRNDHKAPVYRVTQTIKVIDIYDPECKVQEIVVKEWENVHWTHPTKSGNRNYKEYTHAFFTIGAHKATDKDNIKAPTVIDGRIMPGPGKVFSDYKGYAGVKQGGPSIKIPKIRK